MVRRILHPEDDIIRQSQDERLANLEKGMYNIEMSNREKDNGIEAMETRLGKVIIQLMEKHENRFLEIHNKSTACYKKDMEELMKKHENKIEEMQKEHMAEKEAMQTRHKRDLNELMKKHETKIEKLQKEHTEKIQQLTTELEKEKEDNRKLRWEIHKTRRTCRTTTAKVRTLEKDAEKREEKNQQLTTELEKEKEGNRKLRREIIEAWKTCRTTEEKVRMLEELAEKREPELLKYKKRCEELVEVNGIIRENLIRCGVKETSWWKVACLAVVGGVSGFIMDTGVVKTARAAINGNIAVFEDRHRYLLDR